MFFHSFISLIKDELMFITTDMTRKMHHEQMFLEKLLAVEVLITELKFDIIIVCIYIAEGVEEVDAALLVLLAHVQMLLVFLGVVQLLFA
jgi:hypothetical protein